MRDPKAKRERKEKPHEFRRGSSVRPRSRGGSREAGAPEKTPGIEKLLFGPSLPARSRTPRIAMNQTPTRPEKPRRKEDNLKVQDPAPGTDLPTGDEDYPARSRLHTTLGVIVVILLAFSAPAFAQQTSTMMDTTVMESTAPATDTSEATSYPAAESDTGSYPASSRQYPEPLSGHLADTGGPATIPLLAGALLALAALGVWMRSALHGRGADDE